MCARWNSANRQGPGKNQKADGGLPGRRDFEYVAVAIYSVESAYSDAVDNDIPDNTICQPWFYIARAVNLIGYNDIRYNDDSDVTIVILKREISTTTITNRFCRAGCHVAVNDEAEKERKKEKKKKNR